MKVDFLIIGQGIAGTCFAFELLKKKKTFIIIDKFHKKTSSRIALGIYNPLILKWFTKPWHIDKQIEYFYIFYNELNQFFKQDFYCDLGIYKYLQSASEQNNWLIKSVSSDKLKYMSPDLYSIDHHGLINSQFYGLVKHAGRLKINLLLETFRRYLHEKNLIVDTQLNYQDVIIESDSISFQDIHANNIVFCEGASLKNNPYFNYIKLNPTKGELLIIYCKSLDLDKIIHSKFLFIPLGNDYYSVGSTYNWSDVNNDFKTEEARQKIKIMLDKTIKMKYKIVDHYAAIRPSTFDRRALVGRHPVYHNMYILNGLGTRGVLLAPYLSNLLVKHIYLDKMLDLEINVNRFINKKSPQ